jgi:phosphohistidine swiveling domain-containing protein
MSGLASVTALPGTYPGASAGQGSVRPFEPTDDDTFWVLDFHAPRGLTPLALSVFDYVARGAREAADAIPMPGTRGLAARVAANHVYFSVTPVEPDAAGARARRAAERLPALLEQPHAAWQRAAAELTERQRALRAEERTVRGLPGARRFLAHALDAAAHAWRVHFDFMYPLLAGYFMFVDHAHELGIPPSDLPPLLQGYPSRITETDRAIWELAAEGTGTADFRERLSAFLDRYGWRTEGIYEVALVPWIDDPSPILARVDALRDDVRERSFADVESASAAARHEAEQDILTRLTASERAVFQRALAHVRKANFAWWNEDHNPYIDLCVHIPVRRAALAVGSAAGLADPEATFFLFREELEQLADGRLSAHAAMSRVPERRELHASWASRRHQFPPLVGTAPERVDDPVLREIFGLSDDLVAAAATGPPAADLRGIPASAGVARGRARVLADSSSLDSLQPGEVIVCEATTPSWTPAFATAAACVCDQGGRLTHAAIVSREYGVPCVTGTLRATELIETGDLVQVDGGKGSVRILERGRS